MASDFSVALSKMTEDLDLQKVYIAENFDEIKVSTFEVNRPGLELTGYFDFSTAADCFFLVQQSFRISLVSARRLKKWLLTQY